MQRHIWVLATLLLAACGGGYEQAEFASNFASSTCQLYSDCAILETYAGYEELAECESDLSQSVRGGSCAGYNADAATLCLDAITTVTCAQFVDGFWPAECTDVCTNGAAVVQSPTGSDDTGR